MLSTTPGAVGKHTRMPYVDAYYRAARFRPVVAKTTDISIFTKMLTNVTQTEGERV